MASKGIIELAGLVLSVFDKLLDKTPNFNQRKKTKYMQLKRAYEMEKKSKFRDDNLVDNLRDELMLLVEAYSKEIFRA